MLLCDRAAGHRHRLRRLGLGELKIRLVVTDVDGESSRMLAPHAHRPVEPTPAARLAEQLMPLVRPVLAPAAVRQHPRPEAAVRRQPQIARVYAVVELHRHIAAAHLGCTLQSPIEPARLAVCAFRKVDSHAVPCAKRSAGTWLWLAGMLIADMISRDLLVLALGAVIVVARLAAAPRASRARPWPRSAAQRGRHAQCQLGTVAGRPECRELLLAGGGEREAIVRFLRVGLGAHRLPLDEALRAALPRDQHLGQPRPQRVLRPLAAERVLELLELRALLVQLLLEAAPRDQAALRHLVLRLVERAQQHAHRRAALECLGAERAEAELVGQCGGAVVAMEAAPPVASRCATALPLPRRRAASRAAAGCVVAEALAHLRPLTAVVEHEATEALSLGSGVLAAVNVRDAAR